MGVLRRRAGETWGVGGTVLIGNDDGHDDRRRGRRKLRRIDGGEKEILAKRILIRVLSRERDRKDKRKTAREVVGKKRARETEMERYDKLVTALGKACPLTVQGTPPRMFSATASRMCSTIARH